VAKSDSDTGPVPPMIQRELDELLTHRPTGSIYLTVRSPRLGAGWSD